MQDAKSPNTKIIDLINLKKMHFSINTFLLLLDNIIMIKNFYQYGELFG